jgi:hypothetical protein
MEVAPRAGNFDSVSAALTQFHRKENDTVPGARSALSTFSTQCFQPTKSTYEMGYFEKAKPYTVRTNTTGSTVQLIN